MKVTEAAINWEYPTAAARRINGKWLYVADRASVPAGPPPAGQSKPATP